jgi:hypothetical protein
MDELLQLLHDQAATLEDFTTLPPPPYVGWRAEANSEVVNITALTKKLSPDPEDAWHSATGLRDAITGLGYKLHGNCQIGVIAEVGPEDESGPGFRLPICGWRGMVFLVFDAH